MKRLGLVVKYTAVGFLLLVLVFALFPSGKNGALKRAAADSLDAYPNVCLGGWQNPGNAAGTPDVPPGGDSFTGDNSAVLDGVQAQIFCGSFQAGDQSQTPASVTLHFSWNVIFPDQPISSVSTDTDSSAWSGVLDATSSVTSTPAAASSSTSSSTVDQTNAGQDQDDATSTVTPSSTVSPPAAATSTPSDQSSTSLLRTIFSDPLGLLIQRTFADSSDTSAATIDTSTIDTSTIAATGTDTEDASIDTSDGFMDVSYSLDGTTWIDLGQVNASDWQNYSVTIPVASWSDINQLQIQLSPLITTDPPTVYLDGMWLEVDDSQSLLGDLQNSADATLNAVSDLGNAVDNALNSATNAITNLLPSPAASSTAPQDTNASPTPTPPPLPQHQYSFVLQGAQSIKGGKPAWAPQNVASGSAPTATIPTVAPTVITPATNTIQISGTCTATYYTILIFANPGDYEDNPASALYNEASKCVGGNFTQTIADTDLPPQLASGTYYLVIANQGTKGPWVPDSEIYPIDLNPALSTSSSSPQ